MILPEIIRLATETVPNWLVAAFSFSPALALVSIKFAQHFELISASPVRPRLKQNLYGAINIDSSSNTVSIPSGESAKVVFKAGGSNRELTVDDFRPREGHAVGGGDIKERDELTRLRNTGEQV
ncbi:hypothetical protein COW80_02895, partial [Candidatus Beckwithbacteria bacterium CG22_combo_CG10-13_8_21_14_all_01_47_9]